MMVNNMKTAQHSTRSRLPSIGFIGSVLIHASLAVVLLSWTPAAPVSTKKETITVSVTHIKKEAPAPPPPQPTLPPPSPEDNRPVVEEPKPLAEKTPPPPKPVEKVARKVEPKKKVRKVRPRKAAPLPAPNQKPSKVAAKNPAKPVFGVTMNSVVTGGSGPGMAVAVGNTLMTQPGKPVPLNTVKPSAAPTVKETYVDEPAPPVPSFKLTEMPKPRKIVKAKYPENARKLGIEGNVQLRLHIDKTGAVKKAEVVKGIGFGLDQAAQQAALKFRFTPARVNGRPVGTVIRFTYKWEIIG